VKTQGLIELTLVTSVAIQGNLGSPSSRAKCKSLLPSVATTSTWTHSPALKPLGSFMQPWMERRYLTRVWLWGLNVPTM